LNVYAILIGVDVIVTTIDISRITPKYAA